MEVKALADELRKSHLWQYANARIARSPVTIKILSVRENFRGGRLLRTSFRRLLIPPRQQPLELLHIEWQATLVFVKSPSQIDFSGRL
jgi:hypothetical protein